MHRVPSTAATGARLLTILKGCGAHLQTLGSERACVKPGFVMTQQTESSSARRTAHACRTCRDHRHQASKARRCPCAPGAYGNRQGPSSHARTSAGSWSRRMASGPALPAALDSRAAMLHYCVCCSGVLHTEWRRTATCDVKWRLIEAQGGPLVQPGSGCSGARAAQWDCRRSAR